MVHIYISNEKESQQSISPPTVVKAGIICHKKGVPNELTIPAQQNMNNINYHTYEGVSLPYNDRHIVGPDFKWPEVYEDCKSQSALLVGSFPGNSTKSCVAAIDMVVNRC